MQTNKILSAPLIDIIFDGRPKDYGAYELRKTYSKRINKALLITIALAGLICCSAFVANSSKKSRGPHGPKDSVILTEIHEKKIEEPIPEKKPEVKPVKTEIYTAPVIKELVETPPPTQEELADVMIGDQKIDSGDIYTGIPDPKKNDDGKGIIPPRTESQSDEPFRTVEIDAKFIGNWKNFLERNLNGDVPRDNGAPAGRYSVVVEFVVDKEGKVSDIQTLTHHGYGLEEEALRVMRKAPKWDPAIQNGIPVKAYRRQVITFEVSEEG
jgi:periplasmic protein TonB